MSAQLFLEWEAYSNLEPFDEIRADYRAASIVAMIANVNRDPKKNPPFTLDEMRIKFGDAKEAKPRKQTWQEQKSIAQMYVEMYKDEPDGAVTSKGD